MTVVVGSILSLLPKEQLIVNQFLFKLDVGCLQFLESIFVCVFPFLFTDKLQLQFSLRDHQTLVVYVLQRQLILYVFFVCGWFPYVMLQQYGRRIHEIQC